MLKKLEKIFGYRNKHQINSESLISDKYQFIWTGIPKVATRSFLTALYREPKHDYGCIETRQRLSELVEQDKYARYFKFSFVRNPWSRVVSCYKNKIENPNQDVIDSIISRYPGLEAGMSFSEFINFLCRSKYGQDQYANAHWISQSIIISDIKGEMISDFIGKMETMEEDLNFIETKLSLPKIELPKLNTKSGWVGSEKNDELDYYKSYFTSRTIEAIKKRYHSDILRFGYSYTD